MFVGIAFLVVSCVKDATEEKQTQHDADLQTLLNKYGMTAADEIEDGIWAKFDNSNEISPPELPGEKDYVIVDVLGTYANGEVFDVTDSATAEALEVYRSDLVYGPIRLKLENTFYGFFKVLQKVSQGSSAIMVLSHEHAFGGYIPISYEVQLYNLFTDINGYLSVDYFTYLEKMGLTMQDTLSASDSLVFTRVIQEGTIDSVDIQLGDSVFMKLHAYYAESDPSFVNTFPGRQFFPLNELDSEIGVNTEIANFPYVGSMILVLQKMKLGEIRDVLMPPNYVYGSDGFRHPYIGKYIVTPDMPIHYRIELDSVKKNE